MIVTLLIVNLLSTLAVAVLVMISLRRGRVSVDQVANLADAMGEIEIGEAMTMAVEGAKRAYIAAENRAAGTGKRPSAAEALLQARALCSPTVLQLLEDKHGSGFDAVLTGLFNVRNTGIS